MFRESIEERSKIARRMLRMHCLKILEGAWVLEDMVTQVSLRVVGVAVEHATDALPQDSRRRRDSRRHGYPSQSALVSQ